MGMLAGAQGLLGVYNTVLHFLSYSISHCELLTSIFIRTQVVMGVLGCPNMPIAAITDNDGGADAAGRVGDDDVGVIFAAQLGGGSTVGPLKGGETQKEGGIQGMMFSTYFFRLRHIMNDVDGGE